MTSPGVWALDLDGVLWTGREPIRGAADAVGRLRAAGCSVVFVTNNSFATISEQEAKLDSFGVPAEGAVMTSAQAGASLVEPGERVFVFGGPGIDEAVDERGAHRVTDLSHPVTEVDVVLVGLDWELTYGRLRMAMQCVLAGARFIATNGDRSYPTERGLFPGAGSLVAAVERATGVVPTVAGKPERPLAELVCRRFGPDGIMVGDRPETDGRFARALGYDFGLVFSGVTGATDLPVDPEPDWTAVDLASLVDQFL